MISRGVPKSWDGLRLKRTQPCAPAAHCLEDANVTVYMMRPYRVLVREWVCCGCPEQRRTLFQEEQYVYLLGYGLSCCNKDTKSDSGFIEIDAASSLSEQSRGGPRWALIRSVLTWPSCCVAYPRLSMSSLSPRLRLATTIPSMSQCRGRGKERSRDSPFPL